jgi:hypothetical protein
MQLSFKNVTEHLLLQDSSDEAALSAFVAQSKTTSAFWADIVGSGFELHVPVDKLRQSLGPSGLSVTGRTVYYNTANGMADLIRDFRDSWAGAEFTVAGLKLAGIPLSEMLSR